jgi:broad specificity phosphatase PhoE
MRTLQIVLCRHAPRVEGDGDRITEHGKQQAFALGATLRRAYPQRTIHGMSSLFPRACETVAAILAGAGVNPVSLPLHEAALAPPEIAPGGWTNADIRSPDAAFNAYFRFGNTRPAGHPCSPRQVAARLLQMLARHLDATPSPLLWVAVTHSGLIEVLLASLLSLPHIETIGGSFAYLEGVTLLFEEDRALALSLQISLRGQTYCVADAVVQSCLQESNE